MNACIAPFVDYTTAQFLYAHCSRLLSAIPMRMEKERAKVKRDYRELQVKMATQQLLHHFIKLKERDGTWMLAKCTDIEEGGETMCFAMAVTITATKEKQVRHITPESQFLVGGWS